MTFLTAWGRTSTATSNVKAAQSARRRHDDYAVIIIKAPSSLKTPTVIDIRVCRMRDVYLCAVIKVVITDAAGEKEATI